MAHKSKNNGSNKQWSAKDGVSKDCFKNRVNRTKRRRKLAKQSKRKNRK